MNTTLLMKLNTRPIKKICRAVLRLVGFFFFVAYFRDARFQARSVEDTLQQFQVALRRCQDFTSSVESTSNLSNLSHAMPHPVLEMIAMVDHVFIISLNGCNTRLLKSIIPKSTCVHGKVVDGCIADRFISGGYAHAMKVTITHAVILNLSLDAGYTNIAVIEDDLAFLNRKLSGDAVTNFGRLLRSSSWNIIRFGHRPYFLQQSGTKPCPRRCRCVIIESAYGEHLCEMQTPGCDMRSSDFYVLHSRNFLSLRARLLDRTAPNTKRIIDVHPMRAYRRQWIVLPQISYQRTLDIPADYQVGAGALYIKKCAGPRPVSTRIAEQLVIDDNTRES